MFDYLDRNSINKLLTKEDLRELSHGHCLLRILHFIHALRLRQANALILTSKVDFKSAYYQGTICRSLVTKCIVASCSFALLLRYLSFSRAHYSSLWCAVLEFATDLANNLLTCDLWNESEIFSPHIERLSSLSLLDESIPFSKALPADVVVPKHRIDKTDAFIDDIMTLGYYAPW